MSAIEQTYAGTIAQKTKSHQVLKYNGEQKSSARISFIRP